MWFSQKGIWKRGN